MAEAKKKPTESKTENTEQTGKQAASKAGGILANKKSTKDVKTVAASDLTQAPRKTPPAQKPTKTTTKKK